MVEFGEQLRRARVKKGMTQQSLAEQFGRYMADVTAFFVYRKLENKELFQRPVY